MVAVHNSATARSKAVPRDSRIALELLLLNLLFCALVAWTSWAFFLN